MKTLIMSREREVGRVRRALGVMLLSTAGGAAMQAHAPGALSIGQALQQMKAYQRGRR